MIILASKSKARRKLLKNLGIPFRVMPAAVAECHDPAAPPAVTVRRNALLKARDVAGRLTQGAVVACDTLVAQKGKLFGKPRNLQEAAVMLKKLSAKPHRIYTGVAVIDARTKKEYVGVEETKIEMEPLSDLEIRRYFKKVSPLDKAGGFDIQGPGAFFIRRLEGCYFNVVGLPLAKLSKLLKKAGVSLLVFFCVLSFAGCATEFNVATREEDRLMVTADKEASLGEALSRQMEKEYKVINDPELNDRLQRVGSKIVAVCDRQEFAYRFRIIEDEKEKDAVNAVALPGGHIYVFKELLKVAASDDELAAVLGHEVGHVAAKHAVKRLQALWGYNLLALLGGASGDAEFAQGVQFAYLNLLMGYSQEDELTADRLGARYVKRAGFDPEAMFAFLEKLRQRHKKEKPRALSYFRTHPYIAERIRATKEELGTSISFEDFINTN